MNFMTHLPRSSVDERTVKEDYPGFEGHAVSMRPGRQGWLG